MTKHEERLAVVGENGYSLNVQPLGAGRFDVWLSHPDCQGHIRVTAAQLKDFVDAVKRWVE